MGGAYGGGASGGNDGGGGGGFSGSGGVEGLTHASFVQTQCSSLHPEPFAPPTEASSLFACATVHSCRLCASHSIAALNCVTLSCAMSRMLSRAMQTPIPLALQPELQSGQQRTDASVWSSSSTIHLVSPVLGLVCSTPDDTRRGERGVGDGGGGGREGEGGGGEGGGSQGGDGSDGGGETLALSIERTVPAVSASTSRMAEDSATVSKDSVASSCTRSCSVTSATAMVNLSLTLAASTASSTSSSITLSSARILWRRSSRLLSSNSLTSPLAVSFTCTASVEGGALGAGAEGHGARGDGGDGGDGGGWGGEGGASSSCTIWKPHSPLPSMTASTVSVMLSHVTPRHAA